MTLNREGRSPPRDDPRLSAPRWHLERISPSRHNSLPHGRQQTRPRTPSPFSRRHGSPRARDRGYVPGRSISPHHREGNRHVEVAGAEQPPPPPDAPPSSSRMAEMMFWDGTQYILWSRSCFVLASSVTGAGWKCRLRTTAEPCYDNLRGHHAGEIRVSCAGAECWCPGRRVPESQPRVPAILFRSRVQRFLCYRTSLVGCSNNSMICLVLYS